MEIGQLIEQFGVTIGLLIYFVWRDYKTSKEYNDYIKEIAKTAAQAINSSTATQEESNKLMKRIERKLDMGEG